MTDHSPGHRAAGTAGFQRWPHAQKPASRPDDLRLKLMAEPNELFVAVFLDSQNQVSAYEPLFKGTVDAAVVYPRVVVQRALALNASALIFAHQHPSGVTHPSGADRTLTQRLKHALETVDIRVLDHFIVEKESRIPLRSPACCSSSPPRACTGARFPFFYQCLTPCGSSPGPHGATGSSCAFPTGVHHAT